jgi:hypothetical protein
MLGSSAGYFDNHVGVFPPVGHVYAGRDRETMVRELFFTAQTRGLYTSTHFGGPDRRWRGGSHLIVPFTPSRIGLQTAGGLLPRHF